ncbi:MAG: 6-phosphofructokinase [Candidatus Delongbacteria bacterium]|nr:6-phosphofructokinase [Candidatus Delongbacteria bacterium]MBN2834169.1 6-phosphofructokinase [Candidatus Delongbacteria bacterium]
MKRIGVITSGGDCSGMNPCIRSVVRTSISKGIKVFGFKRGYQGILDNDFLTLDSNHSVSNILQRGGTFLQSARCLAFKTDEGLKKGLDNLIDLELDGLIVIGGDGSLTGAHKIHLAGFPTIGVPASIDNDLYGTSMSLGVDTALNAIMNSVDTIRDTASSHERAFIIEVMGRNCGYLALTSAIASGAEAAIIPEVPYDLDRISRSLVRRFKEGKTNSIIILAEGAGSAKEFGQKIREKTGIEIRETVLGHIQRGGSPTSFDRIFASKLGRNAVIALEEGKSGEMIALKDDKYVTVPLDLVLSKQRPLSPQLLDLAVLLES